MAQLQLYQCMSATRFRYENAFCSALLALRDIGTCEAVGTPEASAMTPATTGRARRGKPALAPGRQGAFREHAQRRRSNRNLASEFALLPDWEGAHRYVIDLPARSNRWPTRNAAENRVLDA
ncbi:MAG: hypothetical protein R3C16_12785 [Hyphomonadaceae bacterium]